MTRWDDLPWVEINLLGILDIQKWTISILLRWICQFGPLEAKCSTEKKDLLGRQVWDLITKSMKLMKWHREFKEEQSQ